MTGHGVKRKTAVSLAESSGGFRVTLDPDRSVLPSLIMSIKDAMLLVYDAQNLTESLLAARILGPGVWLVMHNQVFPIHRVVKDRESARFVWKGANPSSSPAP